MYALISNIYFQVFNPKDEKEFASACKFAREMLAPENIFPNFIHRSSINDAASHFTDKLLECKRPMHGVAAMINGALALGACGNGEKFSKLHMNAALLCLKAKCYSHSRKLIDAPLTGIYKSGTEPVDFMSYQYYRGMLYCGLNDFVKAAEAFKNVIMYPTKCVHSVHLDAYKKLQMVTLMNSGKEFELPVDTPEEITRFINSQSQMSS